ncbi:MAG: DUF192 domain-containing protein [Candidatus Aenigmarchaeota archaeon]|nr:DUF192 domain-containing protein [Candidatus Aenigmarchaeota archaeon]
MEKIVLLYVVLVITGCVSQQQTEVILSTTTGQKTVSVEVANGPDEWATGLMNRPSLPENSGMLFVFPDAQHRSFWMKNTLIPLDIIFISEQFEIVDIATLEPCKTDPCSSYLSNAPARYVLEVNANYTRNNNITLGNKAAFYFQTK